MKDSTLAIASACNVGWEDPWRTVATEFMGTGNEIDQSDKGGKLLPLGGLDALALLEAAKLGTKLAAKMDLEAKVSTSSPCLRC